MTDPDLGLALHGIGVRFGGLVALDEVTLRVPPGRTVGVIGPNGAGKTTLFNVICGFVAPTSGTLTLDGRPLRAKPHQLTKLGIARTLQGVGLFAGLTVLENVLVSAKSLEKATEALAPKAALLQRRRRSKLQEVSDSTVGRLTNWYYLSLSRYNKILQGIYCLIPPGKRAMLFLY